MDREKILQALNEALAQEHGCYVRYKTHAAVITGPYAEAVSNRLKEIAADESEHAEKLRDRIDRQEDILFYEVIEDIIEDEQEHREELSRLQEG
jgi:bacterioferritin (cytochrome b1)